MRPLLRAKASFVRTTLVDCWGVENSIQILFSHIGNRGVGTFSLLCMPIVPQAARRRAPHYLLHARHQITSFPYDLILHLLSNPSQVQGVPSHGIGQTLILKSRQTPRSVQSHQC